MAEPLGEERLREIRERADAATPGPWRRKDYVRGIRNLMIHDVVYGPADDAREQYSVTDDPSKDDAEFIAAAREDVPALIAERDRLAALLSEAEALLRDAAAHGEMDQYRRGWEAAREEAAVVASGLGAYLSAVAIRELKAPGS